MSNDADDPADEATPQPRVDQGDSDDEGSEGERARSESRSLRDRLAVLSRKEREEHERLERRRADDNLAERLAHQFAQQWALVRADRRHEPEPIRYGPSNFTRAQVPHGLDLAAAWSWRLIVIAIAGYGLLWVLGYFSVITMPLVVALLIAALASPLVGSLKAVGVPQSASAGLVVIGGVLFVAALLTFAGQQVAQGAADLANQVVEGLGEIRRWLREGPLQASDSQINAYLQQAQESIAQRTRDAEVFTRVTEFGTALGQLVAGFFIVLFATYFFLADGHRIWGWVVRLAPRAARRQVDSSGRIAWVSLTQFVRATVLVALVDAVGIMFVAAILRVPFVAAIGVLVFIGAFIPLLGAAIAGAVAVLVALVDQGPITALLMLGGVVVVQQVEGHVLQPFLMGRWVSVHPLAVIIALGMGVVVAGIGGALIAVPIAAAVNAVVHHLAGYSDVGEDPLSVSVEDSQQNPEGPPDA